MPADESKKWPPGAKSDALWWGRSCQSQAAMITKLLISSPWRTISPRFSSISRIPCNGLDRSFWQITCIGRSLECVVPTDYDNEKWVALYEKAILELEHAKVTGRIEEARAEITQRIEKLHSVPEVHAAELNAINAAHRMLRLLEGEEQRNAAL